LFLEPSTYSEMKISVQGVTSCAKLNEAEENNAAIINIFLIIFCKNP